MSKIEELIKQKCPEGVEYKKVSEVFRRIKGTSITAGKMKEIEDSKGEIRIFAGGRTVINAKEKDIPNANITRVPAVLVQSRGVIDFVYHERPFTFKNEMWAYTTDNSDSVKFLYYIFKNNTAHFREAASGMGSLPQISLPVTENFEIPVPPMEIQKEIVRILDKFTELEVGLQAELDARKKQYEYYMSLVLLRIENSKEYNLEDVCQIIDCPHTSPQWRESGIPVIRNYNLVNGKIDIRNMSYVSEEDYIERTKRVVPAENDILFSREAPIGNVGIVPPNFKCCQGQRVVLLRPKTDIVDPAFLTFLLQGPLVKQQIDVVTHKGGTVSNFNISDLRKLKLIVPPLTEQGGAVSVLKKFDDLCNDYTNGLPAEIEARRKQYEYYRDSLLSFERLGE